MKYKLVCFDLDGTVIDDIVFIWNNIHDALKTDKEARREAMDDFHDGKISYAQWAEHDLMLWKNAGATKQIMLNAIKDVQLIPGARETLTELKNRGIILAVISGSLDFALEKVLPDHKHFFKDVYINRAVFDKDGAVIDLIATKYDFERKADALKEIAERECIPLSEVVYVGDNYNDVKAAEAAGLSIAFNCKSEELATIADVVIKKKDLREILPLILE